MTNNGFLRRREGSSPAQQVGGVSLLHVKEMGKPGDSEELKVFDLPVGS